jgi:hypothetical protein
LGLRFKFSSTGLIPPGVGKQAARPDDSGVSDKIMPTAMRRGKREVQVTLQEADLHGNLVIIFHFSIDQQCAIFQMMIITWTGKCRN